MNDKIDIKSLPQPQLKALFAELGEQEYRASQVFKWLHLGVTSFDEMTDLSKALRGRLSETCFISRPTVARKLDSRKDGTVKYLFELADGQQVESVLMQYKHGTSICISIQAGCKMGCVFCASFDRGTTRNLTAGEMLDQVLFAQIDSGQSVSSVVLMGTGEPLDNYENVLDFLAIITAPGGLNIGMRHISLSTCGIVPKIDALAKEKLQLTLSVSLHAPFDSIRDRIMPVNKRYNIEKLLAACRRYFQQTGRRVSFEYALIKGVNDTPACAKQLCKLLADFNCHVNLIPLNSVPGSPLESSSGFAVRQFSGLLAAGGLNVTVRRSLGGDIDAACGQLRKRGGGEGCSGG